MALPMTPIFTQTVGAGGTTVVSFNNIPQFYTDLKLVISARSTGTNGTCVVHFNGDTTNSNYSTTRLYGTGTSASSERYSFPFFAYTNPSGYTANTFANGEVHIPNYTASNFKQVNSEFVNENNATLGEQFLSAGLWRNTAAVTSIRIAQAIDIGFVQHSTFTLYGIIRPGA